MALLSRVSDISNRVGHGPSRRSGVSGSSPFIVISRSGNLVRLPLREGRQIVGGSASCDVVALGVSPKQAFALDVVFDGAAKRARLEVLCPEVIFNNETHVAGAMTTLFDGDKIGCDGVEFWLEGVTPRAAKIKRRQVAAACLLATSILLLFVGLQEQRGVTTLEPSNAENSSRSSFGEVGVLVNELTQALRMSGLMLDVVWNEASATIDIGQAGQPLTLAAKTQLGNLVQAFGRRSNIPLRDMTKLSSGVENLIASIALEPVKFIVGTDGRRYREGDAIGGDWKIERISTSVITVARGDQRDEFSIDPLSGSSGLRLASQGEASVR